MRAAPDTPAMLPLAGVVVVELGTGVAAAYAGRLLVDAGARVQRVGAAGRGVARDASPEEQAFAAWLDAGKSAHAEVDAQALCAAADIVLLGEAADDATRATAATARPRLGTIELSWFGARSGYARWHGSDLVVQALTGMPRLAGAVEGPPLGAGDRQASLVAGVTAYIAACSLVLCGLRARVPLAPRWLEVSVMEANIAMAEMLMYYYEVRPGVTPQRAGINRFPPNVPVGIYPCRDGWVGVTAATPDQWRTLCAALDLGAVGSDVDLVTRELRFERADVVEAAMCLAFAALTADELAALGRRVRVPIVVVPDAQGILSHPIFGERRALVDLHWQGHTLRVPRAPFGMAACSAADALQVPPIAASPLQEGALAPAPAAAPEPPLQGVRILDFTMGWAGPLATRLLADLGAEVWKVEAARYPDWWRGMNWSPAFIAERQHEKGAYFNGMNRGKRGLSLDLTTEAGRALALELADQADAVVENQAAGVLAGLGIDWARVRRVRGRPVMASMSAFGSDNAWSSTRAYGSTLEQASGLPSFVGMPDGPPTMTALAHGDPIGGLYGCAAVLTALIARERSGTGEFVNCSMSEAMLQFASGGLIEHQLRGAYRRWGNRHPVHAPHGVFPAEGEDAWVAVTVLDDAMFHALVRAIGRPDWATDAGLAGVAGRQARADELEAGITQWLRGRTPREAAALLQAAGVAAAHLPCVNEVLHDTALAQAGFFVGTERAVSGPQRQAASAFVQDGQRLVAASPAPLLGEHTWAVLHERLGMPRDRFEALVAAGVIGFDPRPARNLVATSDAGANEPRLAQ